MNYQPMINYGYQQIPQPYPDKLAQLQNQYQQSINYQQQNQINQGLLWVSGEVGAKSYLVAPNSTVLLMDSDAQRFYLKSADGAGMPSMRIFEYNEVSNMPQNSVIGSNKVEKELYDKYVTRAEYDDLKRQYDAIIERLDSISFSNAEIEQPSKSKPRGRGANADE